MKSFFFDESEIVPRTTKRKPRPSRGCPCGLDKGCKSPKMPPHGDNRLSIAVVAEAPGKDEDLNGIPLVGKAGQFLRGCLRKFDIDLDDDCIKLNVIQCRPPGNRTPTQDELLACRPRVTKQLQEIQPDLIFAFGTPAISEILRDAPFAVNATNMHSRVVPSNLWNCWVACGFHPSWFIREKHKYDGRMMEVLEAGLSMVGPYNAYEDQRLDENAFEIVCSMERVEQVLCEMSTEKEVAFDYEATSFTPYAKKSRLLTVAFSNIPTFGYCIPLKHPQARWTEKELRHIYSLLKNWLCSDTPKIIQNQQCEELWSRIKLGVGINNVICDTMVREHVLDNRRGVCSQGFQTYVRYGTLYKGQVNPADLEHEFLQTVARYNCLDARYLLKWKQDQDKQMIPDLERAYELFHEAIPVMVSLKQRGIKVDRERLDELEKETQDSLDILTDKQGADCLTEYQKKYGKTWDSGSHQAQKRLFYGVMGLNPLKLTGKGTDTDNPDDCATDAESLKFLLNQVESDSENAKIIESCQHQAHLVKLAGYCKGYRKLMGDGDLLHPSFLLHSVSSYRSSSIDPNFQNIPVRLPLLAMLRICFIPRYNWLMELDFSGAEVRMLACESKDKRLIYNIRNNVDYHRYYAALLYQKPENEITPEERYKGKNGFTFPEFYGDYYKGIAKNNPQWTEKRIQEVEEIFWDDLADLKAWKEKLVRFYQKEGYIPYKTGFRAKYGRQGFLNHKQIGNFPSQGPSFHRLLKVLLIMEKQMRERKMESWICGQIHDSIVFDVIDAEVEDVEEMGRIIVKRSIWDWDKAVPWEAEWKIGRNLLEMEKV